MYPQKRLARTNIGSKLLVQLVVVVLVVKNKDLGCFAVISSFDKRLELVDRKYGDRTGSKLATLTPVALVRMQLPVLPWHRLTLVLQRRPLRNVVR
jgi:hypothetical protein